MSSTQTDVIDGVSASTALKAPVRTATTANITLSGEQTIDGVSVVEDDRVLVKDQTNTVENGIYKVSVTAWARAADFDGNRDVKTGTLINVRLGTVNIKTIWRCTTADPIVIGTSAITFDQFLGNITQATTATLGVLKTATDVIAQGKVNTTDALTPSNLAALDSSETFSGLSERASTAEAQGMTDDVRYLTSLKMFQAMPAHLAAAIVAAVAKSTPVDADLVALADSAASFILKKLSWANIKATLLSSFTAAQSDQETATSTTLFVTSGRQHFNPCSAKFWFKAGVTANLLASYNMTSLTDVGTGEVGGTIANDFSGADYAILATIQKTTTSLTVANSRQVAVTTASPAAGTFALTCWDQTVTTNLVKDPEAWHVAGFGDQ